MPAARDEREPRLENTGEESALAKQRVEVFFDVAAGAPHLSEDSPDANQHQDVKKSDQE